MTSSRVSSMQSLRLTLIALVAATMTMAASPKAKVQDANVNASALPGIFGVWHNPKNSVQVDIQPCGANACGYIIWANEKAQADAREGGTPNLIGLQLFREFKPRKRGRWRGKVFVPDLNATFSGSARTLDTTSLRAKGCLFAGIFCKTQVWKRIGAEGETTKAEQVETPKDGQTTNASSAAAS